MLYKTLIKDFVNDDKKRLKSSNNQTPPFEEGFDFSMILL